jgi:hypothetical protein
MDIVVQIGKIRDLVSSSRLVKAGCKERSAFPGKHYAKRKSIYGKGKLMGMTGTEDELNTCSGLTSLILPFIQSR